MRVGRDCEISTIIDVTPELVEIGPETFFADGIYLGGPLVHRGTVTLARTTLSRNTFLGNHVVIPAGQRLPEDILLGVCTVADDRIMVRSTSWFGQPPFELPRREIVECDRSLTHEPSPIRYLNRLFWESLRFAIPVLPLTVFLGWLEGSAYAQAAIAAPVPLAAALLLVSLASVATPCVVILLMKWALLGRVKPGSHPLWSCWCSRWDFLYVAWGVIAGAELAALEGTVLLTWYLRAMGMKLGKGVVLGSGFAHVVDPDMLEIDDGATVSAMFQAHTFEDRVLKIDRIHIGRRATLASATVPFYGAVIGAGTYVAPHSVVMKRERLLPGVEYEGAPTVPRRL
jgi:non-ribosomal peptide synthetase-like protein